MKASTDQGLNRNDYKNNVILFSQVTLDAMRKEIAIFPNIAL